MTPELAQVGGNATCEVQVWCRHCKSLSPIPFETGAKSLPLPRTHLSNADHTQSRQFPAIQSVSPSVVSRQSVKESFAPELMTQVIYSHDITH